jgi:hypothetical protein
MQASQTGPISRYPVPAIADLPEDVRSRILSVQEKSGFVPNVFLALAHRTSSAPSSPITMR